MAVATTRTGDQPPGLLSRISTQFYDLSVAEKMFGLLALLVVVVGLLTATSFQTIRLQAEYRSVLATSSLAAASISRVNALIYAVVMESRGIYMSTERMKVRQFGDELLKRTRELGSVISEWKAAVRDDDVVQFSVFEGRIEQFIDFRRELARRGTEIGPEAARLWGDNDENRILRSALNADLESLAVIYSKRAQEAVDIGDRNTYAAWYLLALGVMAFALAGLIVLVVTKCVTGPLSELTRATARVAAGVVDTDTPFSDRQDEIGRLACALQKFRSAVRRNFELEQLELATARQRDTAMEQRDRLNDKLLETKWQLRAALNNMAQGLVMLDSKTKILVANNQYKKMYELPAELFGPDCKLVDILEYRSKNGLFAGDVQETVNAIVGRIAKGKRAVTELLVTDGRIIRVSEQPMDGGGWVATHEEFTEQRRAERVLARTERFLAAVIENVTQAIVAKDTRNLRYIFVNRAAEKLFGLPRSEIVGKTARDLFPVESAEMIESQDRQLLASDGNLDVAAQAVETPNNGWRRVSARRLRLVDDDNDSHILLSLIDDRTDALTVA